MILALGVQLDVSHYNALLNIYLNSENKCLPSDFLQVMANAKVKPNGETFRLIISKLCNQGKITEAKAAMELMRSEQIPINEDILSSFTHGYSINK